MQSSDFENDIKANALQKSAPYSVTSTTATTASRIALTKTTFLTPIQQKSHSQHLQSQQHKQKQLYTTLKAKQTSTSTGSVSSTNLGKVVLKDFKGNIKPLLAKTILSTTAATKTTIIPTTTSPLTSTIANPIQKIGEGEVSNLNVAIVAAKRPQLTIVATKTAALVNNTPLGATTTATTSAAPLPTNVIFRLI